EETYEGVRSRPRVTPRSTPLPPDLVDPRSGGAADWARSLEDAEVIHKVIGSLSEVDRHILAGLREGASKRSVAVDNGVSTYYIGALLERVKRRLEASGIRRPSGRRDSPN